MQNTIHEQSETIVETPTKRIVRKFGGQAEMARVLGIIPSVVQGWLDRDLIPQRRFKKIIEEASKLPDGRAFELGYGDFFEINIADLGREGTKDESAGV